MLMLGMGLLYASSSVTVIVLVDPALSEVGFAITVDLVVEMAAGWITAVA